MKDLEGRVAVVAGATRGAGRSTTNFFFRKRRFSGGDVCGVAPVPPPAGGDGGWVGGTLI